MEFRHSRQSLLSWRSIFAGLSVAFISYLIFSALGAAIGAATIARALSSGRETALSTGGAIIWMGISILLSLAIGSYFAARTSTVVTNRISAAHGVVIASLFFTIFIYGAGLTLGMSGNALSQLTERVGGGAFNLEAEPRIQALVEDSLSNTGLILHSDPEIVIHGLISRLLRGESDSALNYFADQTGLPPDEVDSRFSTLVSDFDQAVLDLGTQAVQGIAIAGWVLFLTMFGGVAAAAGGGILAVRMNLRLPLEDEENTAHFMPRTALT